MISDASDPLTLPLDLDDDPSWIDIVDMPTEGRFSHANYTPAATVAIVRNGHEIALADAFAYHLTNQYCYDSEYYLVVRVRTTLTECPWQDGDVCVAFDTFHDQTYVRDTTPPDDTAMSYGGDWDDLQLLVDTDYPHPAGPRPIERVSDATVLRAVRENDLDLLHRAPSAGGNPDAGFVTPSEATRSVSVDRDTYALAESSSPAITAALLAAGATVDGPRGHWLTPLQRELRHGRSGADPEKVRLLLDHGADPDAGDPSARELARRLGAPFTTMFTDPVDR